MAQIPRKLKPEMVNVGDLIRVIHPPTQGVTFIVEGVVHEIVMIGNAHYFNTSEGGTLMVWVHKVTKLEVILVYRPEYVQTSLDFVETFIGNDIRERMA